MQISMRLKATLLDLLRRAKHFVTPFAIDEFVHQIMAKDIGLLRQRYQGVVPSSITATDLAAYLELHDASLKLISDHCVTEGFHVLRGADFFQVVKTVHGRRHNIAVLQHIHAALIVYCEHLLADLRSQALSGVSRALQVQPTVTKTDSRLRVVTNRHVVEPTTARAGQSAPSKNRRPSRHHLHLVN